MSPQLHANLITITTDLRLFAHGISYFLMADATDLIACIVILCLLGPPIFGQGYRDGHTALAAYVILMFLNLLCRPEAGRHFEPSCGASC